MIRACVAGATGYTGAELVALLARHPGVRLEGLYAGAHGAGASLSDLHPSLAGRPGPRVEPLDPDALAAHPPDVVFLALPHQAAADLAPSLMASGARVIDLSGAHRLRDAGAVRRWYGFAPPDPALLAGAVYGLSEWCNGELAGARLVANPGCYPTSILLALKPVQSRLDRSQPVICDSKSGTSGAGRRSDAAYGFSELDGNVKAYGVGSHRHEPEIRQALGWDESAPLTFVPHLLPMVRGILSTLHVAFETPLDEAALWSLYAEAYADCPFVHVLPAGRLPELRRVVGTPHAGIGFALLDGGRRGVLVCVIDNLLKGAASQAVQNLNRMFGRPEDEGLR
jgi:N-acetyl-gamma-glutamyl-phosphate reductase